MKGGIRFFCFPDKVSDFSKEFLINLVEMGGGGDFSFTLRLEKHESAVNQIPVLPKQLAVAAQLELFPGKFRVLVFRGIGGNRIADLISGELLEKCLQIDHPSVRLAKLPAFEVIEFVCRKFIDELIGYVLSHCHRGEKNRMERDV